MNQAEHTIPDLLSLRRNADARGDWTQARRITEELAERGVFAGDATGPELAEAARRHRITPSEAQEKALRVAKRGWAARWRRELA